MSTTQRVQPEWSPCTHKRARHHIFTGGLLRLLGWWCGTAVGHDRHGCGCRSFSFGLVEAARGEGHVARLAPSVALSLKVRDYKLGKSARAIYFTFMSLRPKAKLIGKFFDINYILKYKRSDLYLGNSILLLAAQLSHSHIYVKDWKFVGSAIIWKHWRTYKEYGGSARPHIRLVS